MRRGVIRAAQSCTALAPQLYHVDTVLNAAILAGNVPRQRHARAVLGALRHQYAQCAARARRTERDLALDDVVTPVD